MNSVDGYLRIGELSRRTGVSPELLRAWESRYGLLEPTRTEGGFRLYSDRDERRVRMVTKLIAEGVSAAEAARRAVDDPLDPLLPGTPHGDAGEAPVLVEGLLGELAEALRRFDAQRAHEVLDRAFASLTVESVLRDLVLVYLRVLGDRWAAGDATIAEEHSASNLIRGRLLGLARAWGAVAGPGVLVACPPGEWHDLGAISFGIVTAQRGRQVTFLGADCPYATMGDAIRAVRPELVVLAVTDRERARLDRASVAELGRIAPVAIGGITEAHARELGVRRLPGDPVTAAIALG